MVDCRVPNIHPEFGNWKHLNLVFHLSLEIGKETGVKLSFVCVGRHRGKKNRTLASEVKMLTEL